MKIITKFSPEITIKSRPIRIFFINILITNIKNIFKRNNEPITIIRHWDYLEIKCKNNQRIYNILQNIPGIHHFLLVEEYTYTSLQDIYQKIALNFNNKNIIFAEKTFCIRVKRYGNQNFTSKEAECYLGNKIIQMIKNIKVNLTNPEKIIYIEIKHNKLFIVIKRYEGLNGFPIGTQKELLSLISGGFDSAVSSYMLIRRGCTVNYCFFNLGGSTHIIEVQKIVFYLWNKFSSSHKVKFITIDCAEIIKEIFSKIKHNYMGIILKRMMMRIASVIANHLKVKALITGEAIGQVSSQTLNNITIIDNASTHVIFRPLISYDKEQIINLAKKIGTEIFSKNIPEYCAITSKNASTKINKKYIELEEKNFDFSILARAVSQAKTINVHDIPNDVKNNTFFQKIKTTHILNKNDILLDIRPESDRNKKPLFLNNTKIQHIPFYELINQFSKLDQNKTYLLYCDNGIISRSQAIYLYDKGFINIKIYQPTK
ncbi:tRNA uracil 4-sulfurtransferase ThiI [Candidatus Blochmannia ocreatus (nom. nud.)]|uniref:tRNA sulfurtransferase n=1 Tax=Candidatus Blochmannia ocreatus (nom. nud.) TaxID=251538 RepID=A0ABY4SWZ0_9ENTR|nr:tRNA uracil 4-sulfurtransferase ThiI [Candidatus Blochmannia ocreatus]URJ25306.1 tRNA 4-thiouridine(8) synthase ThiI [Candidatus Blochmannia ocreatus]